MAIAKKKKACTILFILQFIGEAVLALSLIASDMIPANYLIMAISVEIIMLVVTWELYFLRADESNEKGLAIRRGIAAIISIVVFIVSLVGYTALDKVADTLKEITSKNTVTTVVGVYVRADDPAKSIKDAASYDFGYSTAFDEENVQTTLKKIKKEIGKTPKTEEYEDSMEMVDALYGGDIDAIVLNESYASIIQDQEEYESFNEDTKLIYEYQIVTKANNKKTSGDLSKFVIYLSGSDTRSKMLDVSRSDVNILMVVNTETKEILLVNTPRDYYVPISVSSSGKRDKLTHCGIYGIDCSMDTLSALYGQDIDYYAQINFTGFETLIDSIGGVTVNADSSFSNKKVTIQKGENHLNGSQALAFARDRHHQKDGDNGRGRNQMKLITAVVNKMSAGTVLANYSDILKSLQGMFVTDMSSSDINTLIKMQLSDMASWNIHSYAVTGYDASSTTYSMPKFRAYVMKPNQQTVDQASELMQRVLAGDKLTDADVKKAK